MRALTLDDIIWTVTAEQDDIPVRGNALASGDDAEDKRAEDEILRRLDDGDVWAWASVKVTGHIDFPSSSLAAYTVEAHTYLGGCSYTDERDFCQPGGYYDDMKREVLAELQEIVDAIVAKLGAAAASSRCARCGEVPGVGYDAKMYCECATDPTHDCINDGPEGPSCRCDACEESQAAGWADFLATQHMRVPTQEEHQRAWNLKHGKESDS